MRPIPDKIEVALKLHKNFGWNRGGQRAHMAGQFRRISGTTGLQSVSPFLVGAKAAIAMETDSKNPETETTRRSRILAGDDVIASVRSKNRDEIGQLLAVMEPYRKEVRIPLSTFHGEATSVAYPDSPKETGLPVGALS